MVSGVIEGPEVRVAQQGSANPRLIDLSVTALYLPMESVLFPEVLHRPQRARQLGWVLMALSIGGLVGALSWTVLSRIASRRACRPHRGADLRSGEPGHLPCCHRWGSSWRCAPSSVWCTARSGPIYNSVMQTRTPESMRGPGGRGVTSMTYAAGPVGFMLAGPLIDSFGLRATFLVLAVPILLIGLAAPWIPALRELDEAPAA